jgi:hypothetical protein
MLWFCIYMDISSMIVISNFICIFVHCPLCALFHLICPCFSCFLSFHLIKWFSFNFFSYYARYAPRKSSWFRIYQHVGGHGYSILVSLLATLWFFQFRHCFSVRCYVLHHNCLVCYWVLLFYSFDDLHFTMGGVLYKNLPLSRFYLYGLCV